MKKRITTDTFRLIRESNEFGIDDRLSAILNQNTELSEEELELVSAAASPNYEKFRHIIDSKNKG